MAKLSSAELAAREKFIQGMKKNKRKLIKKYGADAEKVMYGSSTKKAKKLAERDMGQNKLREMVKVALMQPVSEKFPDLTGDDEVTKADILKGRGIDLKEGPEDRDWAVYVKSLVNDIRINGLGGYKNFSEDDFVADYEEYIGGKMDIDEDLDLGHEDDEPHMIKAELYRIGKYAMELYQMVDQFEGMGEVDFPAWWQSKITTSANNMVSAKHYLDFETKEPEIDAMVGAIDMSGALDNIGVEDEIEEGIHDRDITSASHTNIKGEMGDYDPKKRAANLAKLKNFGPKEKDDEIEETLAGKIAKKLKEDIVKGSNVKKVGDKYRVLSGKTGKMWPQKYDSKKDAEAAIQAYHANKAK